MNSLTSVWLWSIALSHISRLVSGTVYMPLRPSIKRCNVILYPVCDFGTNPHMVHFFILLATLHLHLQDKNVCQSVHDFMSYYVVLPSGLTPMNGIMTLTFLRGPMRYMSQSRCQSNWQFLFLVPFLFLFNRRQDKQVNELAQELATHLGLKNRKPYVSSKVSENDYVCPFGRREQSSSALVT